MIEVHCHDDSLELVLFRLVSIVFTLEGFRAVNHKLLGYRKRLDNDVRYRDVVVGYLELVPSFPLSVRIKDFCDRNTMSCHNNETSVVTYFVNIGSLVDLCPIEATIS